MHGDDFTQKTLATLKELTVAIEDGATATLDYLRRSTLKFASYQVGCLQVGGMETRVANRWTFQDVHPRLGGALGLELPGSSRS